MDTKGRTIQIFLPFGSPRGIKIAEITNRTVQAIYIPRHELKRAELREEVKNVGIYYLFGQSEEESKPEVYIGESENCYNRLNEHNREKEFWEEAIVIVTNNAQNQFTKTDVKFLERYSFEKAKEISRYKLNQTTPQESFVPEWQIADLYDIFDTIKILLATLGYPIFEELRKSKIDQDVDVYEISSKGIQAKGEYNEDGFVVFKESGMYANNSKSIHNYLVNLRETLKKDQIVKRNNDHYVFMEDFQFNSPSQAAAVVLGRSANGWTEWKNKNGKTLDEVKRQNK